jgi:Ca2+-binding RTX toxin-like protein
VTSSRSGDHERRTVRRWVSCAGAFVAAAAALWPVPADAATVSVRASAKNFNYMFGSEVAYVAAAGETNRVVVSPALHGSPWTVTDSGAPLSPGAGCSAVDPLTVRGFAPSSLMGGGLLFADVQLGDQDDEATIVQPELSGSVFLLYGYAGEGNDVLSVPDPGGELHGGLGDDRLVSSTSTFYGAVLDGGGGRDELRGGAGNETLSDGDLDDASTGSAPGPDVIDGGYGEDTVTYAHRTAAVSVDLTAGKAGAPGEDDVLSGVENIVGSPGRDRLAGDGIVNVIDGLAGRDVLVGRAGDDEFANGGGPISCGRGDDVIALPTFRDYLKPGCERVSVSFDQRDYFAYPSAVRSTSVQYRIHCFDDLEESVISKCSGRMTLSGSGSGAA